MAAKAYKIVLLGDAGSGKTTWVNRLTTGTFSKDYTPTIGATATTYEAYARSGLGVARAVTLHLWDVSGNEETEGLGQAYYVGASGAILFLDGALSTQQKRESQRRWMAKFRLVSNAPVEVVTTKCDAYPSKLKGCTLTSSRSNYNYTTALEKLVRGFQGSTTLYLTDDPNCKSVPEVTLSMATIREYERRLREEVSGTA